MNFQTAIATALSKFAVFSGRASRSEFWWFYLFTTLLTWGVSIVGNSGGQNMGDVMSLVVSLVFLVPILAAGSRRLHDIGRSGWWQLLMLTIIGLIPLIYWWACESNETPNSYGQPALVAR